MPMELFFSILWMSLTLARNVMSLKSGFLANSLSAFVTLAGWWSAGLKYLTKHHLKYSLSSIFWISINSFLRWSNSFGNLI